MNNFKKIIQILGLLLLYSCNTEMIYEPQDPIWHKESCARCGMILSEKRFAVQALLNNGDIHFYDDLNCALKHGHKTDEATHYVRPEGTEKWVLARDVKYVSGLRTPMGSGHGAVMENGTITFGELKEKFKD